MPGIVWAGGQERLAVDMGKGRRGVCIGTSSGIGVRMGVDEFLSRPVHRRSGIAGRTPLAACFPRRSDCRSSCKKLNEIILVERTPGIRGDGFAGLKRG